jgi:hypothetical protein
VTEEEVADVCSTIGNLVRIALVVRPSEARAALDAARRGPLETLLLDPRKTPVSEADHQLNRQLLEAFDLFRSRLELFGQPLNLGVTAEG